mmetsp:Transcript_60167/g.105405  ORF Transcript_60167/g.105405 Transcript_60167/m.105405 type:complete len:249 (-) Transcript_60167:157-903(-)
MTCFQVKLGAEWKDLDAEEDRVLKRALMTGSSEEKVRSRGQEYIFDLKRMVQINKGTKKERPVRPPSDWKLSSKPLVPPGPKTVMTIKRGDPGATVQIPHPKVPGAVIFVKVPARAKVGQTLLVPVPPADAMKAIGEVLKPADAAAAASGKGEDVALKPPPILEREDASSEIMLLPVPTEDDLESEWCGDLDGGEVRSVKRRDMEQGSQDTPDACIVCPDVNSASPVGRAFPELPTLSMHSGSTVCEI